MRRNATIIVSAALLGIGTLAIGARAYAEGGLTLEERVQRLERRGEMPAAATDTSGLQKRLDALEAAIKKPPFGLTVGGMVVGSYLYDLNDPQAGNRGTVGLRGFDKDHNTFSLDLFQLQVSRAPGENGVGFVTKVNFGKVAERMAADWDGDGTVGNVAEEQNSIELEEAYITYNFPGLPDLQLKGGKFVTLLGAEVIESPRNPNISRSLAFSFSIPFTHTGLLMSYAVSPQVNLIGGIVNGWDNVIDSNDGKTFMGSVTVSPADQFARPRRGPDGARRVPLRQRQAPRLPAQRRWHAGRPAHDRCRAVLRVLGCTERPFRRESRRIGQRTRNRKGPAASTAAGPFIVVGVRPFRSCVPPGRLRFPRSARLRFLHPADAAVVELHVGDDVELDHLEVR
ncbi:MAG: outer membrane beta-barrel protein [Deltaproteobacteria bacterium]|nr:outer membrane beta-barrel protein [Deltaproteobacteria bacterium]